MNDTRIIMLMCVAAWYFPSGCGTFYRKTLTLDNSRQLRLAFVPGGNDNFVPVKNRHYLNHRFTRCFSLLPGRGKLSEGLKGAINSHTNTLFFLTHAEVHMLLAIDIGNTNILIGLYADGGWRSTWSIPPRPPPRAFPAAAGV